jgi:hypothetical protein
MIEAIAGIGIFLVLWMFFNPLESAAEKQVSSPTHRHDSNLAQGMLILLIALMFAFAVFGSAP